MQYTDLTRKELQREYSRLTRKYTDFIRQPVELDLTTEDSLPGCANRRAVKHFGTVLDKELRDTGAAHPPKHRMPWRPWPRCPAVPTARWNYAAKQASALTPSTTARCWRARSRRISGPTS